MGDQRDQPWNPYDLFTDEHTAILQTSDAIDGARAHIRELAHSLAYDGLLPVQDVQWLINMAYCALRDVKDLAWQVDYEARVRQLASQPTIGVTDPPAELPAYEPVELPAWLLALDHQEGG